MSVLNPVNKSYCLAKLCEANYAKLVALIPGLAYIPETATASADGKPSLHLKLIERSPYTLTLELTHCFTWEFGALLEPAVRIRIYLDARAAEVLSDHARPCVLAALKDERSADKVLDYKWSLNYFLSQWLDHCLQSRYHFGLDRPAVETWTAA
jgi:uncharacterized protein YqiB (DUF1249 family)